MTEAQLIQTLSDWSDGLSRDNDLAGWVEQTIGLPVHWTTGDRATASCGKLFDEVCSAGIVPGSCGDLMVYSLAMSMFDSLEQAKTAYVSNVNHYKDMMPKTGKLYWRVKPWIEEHEGKYRVYSRLVIG